MLEVKDIHFQRDNNLQFTYDFSLKSGSILAVQGPSGVGKTTLLDLVAGFETPQRGSIAWNGRDFSSLPPWERPITTVFQCDNLFAHLTCRQNIEIALASSSLRIHRPLMTGFGNSVLTGSKTVCPPKYRVDSNSG